MIKRELAKDPKLADQDWSRFLPKFGKRKAAKQATATGANGTDMPSNAGPIASTSSTPFPSAAPPKKEKKPYTPFPPAQTPRKIDLQLESGEYFLKNSEKKKRKLEERYEKEDTKKEERLKKRAEMFVPPNEDGAPAPADGEKKKKKRKREAEEGGGEKKSVKFAAEAE